jgi:hypothetical protein
MVSPIEQYKKRYAYFVLSILKKAITIRKTLCAFCIVAIKCFNYKIFYNSMIHSRLAVLEITLFDKTCVYL